MSRKYKNPPLVEAICEFQFAPTSEWDIAIPGLVYEQLKETFPIREQVSQELEFAVVANAEGGIQPQVRTVAKLVRFVRDDKEALVQLGPHLLSINHLKPYPTWEEYLPLVQRVYDVYQKVAQPQVIGRIGLRYINRIEIPSSTIGLADYFQFYPHLGSGFPKSIGPFITGVQIAYDERDVLQVQLANAVSERVDCISMVLDIDYSLLDPQKMEVGSTQEWLQVAHDRIEQIFEACLTDKLRTMFEEESE